MRLFFAFLLVILTATAHAASPTFQQFNVNQFNTTGNRVSVKTGALLTNTFFYADALDASSGAFGTARFRFVQPNATTFTLFDNNGPSDVLTWSASSEVFTILGGVTANDYIANNSITLGGETRTTWPIGSSGPFTNLTVKTADNVPDATTGSALILKPQEVPTVPGAAAKLLEYLPPYTNVTFRARVLDTMTVVTNTLGDTNNDIIFTRGFNSPPNASGTSSFGPVDTNQPSWIEQRESTWQNLAGFSQMEYWNYWASPYTPWGTNFGWRWMGFTPVWRTGSNTYASSLLDFTSGQVSFRNPTGTNDAGITMTFNPNTTTAFLTVDGTITQQTNQSGLGGIEIEGGTLRIGAPDSVAANNMILRTDWNNGFGVRPDSVIYPSGVSKALQIGGGANFWTNFMVNTHLDVDGMFLLKSNNTSLVWTHPTERGQMLIWNSNGTPYVLQASLATLTWASTNLLLGGGSGTSYEYPNTQPFIEMDAMDPIGTIKHSDNSNAIVVLNDPSKAVQVGLQSTDSYLMENSKIGIRIGNNVRQAFDSAETPVIDWTTAGAINIDGFVLDTATWDDGDVLVINSGSVVGTTAPILTIGSLVFEENTGGPLVDLPVTDSSTDVIGYTNRIDGIDVTWSYASRDGNGSVTNPIVTVPPGVQFSPLGNTNYAAYAAGSVYTVTTTPALADFGTTDPTITIAQPGLYKLDATVSIKYNATTYGAAQTFNVKLRRTNNTAADIANATQVLTLPVLTLFTGGDVVVTQPVYYQATRGDIVQVWVSNSADPSAGTVTAETASITATRLQ